MKSLIVTVAAVALAGGTWSWVSPPSEHATDHDMARQDAVERTGVKRMLMAREDLNLANLVIGSGSAEGLRIFRARLIDDGHARPVFGQARRTCDAAPDIPECWDIALLRVDGEDRDLKTPVLPSREAPQPEEEVIETSEIPDLSTPVELPAVEPTPEATHLVARPVINTRSGPGLNNPVLFRLPKGARLGLLAEDQNWGKFLVLDGDSAGSEVWASLTILEDLR